MTRRGNILSAALLTVLATSALMAQNDNAGFSDDVVKDKANNEKWRSGQTKFPSKPKDMWEVGIHGGYLQYAGDVNSQPGYAFGLHVRKSLGYVFSVRANAMYGVAYGLNYLASNRGVGINGALGVNSSLPTAATSGIVAPNNPAAKGYGYNIQAPTAYNGAGNTYKKTGTGLPFYYNYRSEYAEASMQGIITLNNLKFHKERTKWDLFLIGGIGVQYYNTKHDALDKNGKLYDFRNVKAKVGDSKGGNIDLFGGRDVQEELKGFIGTEGAASYETQGEAWGNLENPFLPGNKGKINVIANGGAGIGYHLSKRVTIALEHQVTFNDDDLLDGYRWTEQGDFTQNKDFPHYTNVRLNIHLGSSKTHVEPLWWLNPLDAPYAQIAKTSARPDPTDMMKDTDGDGVPDKLDREPNTPTDCPVDTRGASLDSDGDGVKDCDDKEPFTAPGYPVDPNGVATKPLTNIDCSVCGAKSEWFLPMVNFNMDSYCIKPEFQAQLKHVATVMTKNPTLCVEIDGYTDDDKPADYSQGLAYNRAKAVADYLTNNYGVANTRMKIKIKGEDNVVKGNEVGTSAAKYMNRRVEMKVADCAAITSDEAPATAATAGNATDCGASPYDARLLQQGNPVNTGTFDNNNGRPTGGGRTPRQKRGSGIIKR